MEILEFSTIGHAGQECRKLKSIAINDNGMGGSALCICLASFDDQLEHVTIYDMYEHEICLYLKIAGTLGSI